jgi:hypothetical protein
MGSTGGSIGKRGGIVSDERVSIPAAGVKSTIRAPLLQVPTADRVQGRKIAGTRSAKTVMAHDVIVAVDGIEASEALLSGVAAKIGGTTTSRVIDCRPTPAPPPELLESRGAEDPQEEQEVERHLADQQARWTARAVADGERIVVDAARALAARGIASERIATMVTGPRHTNARVADLLLDVARDCACDTIALGEADVADELRERAPNVDVWVFGT